MELSEIRKRLSEMNRTKVAKATGLKYMWLYAVQTGRIEDPGSIKLDVLRAYLLAEEVKQNRH